MKSPRVFMVLLLWALILLTTQVPSSALQQQSQNPSAQQASDESQASPEAKEKLRKLREQPKTYQVGYSPAMERKLAELTGIEIPKNESNHAKKIRADARRLLAQQQAAREKFEKEHPEEKIVDASPLALIRQKIEKDNPGRRPPRTLRDLIPLLPALDWHDYDVTAAQVKDQGKCNSCWAFASLAAFESSLYFQDAVTRVTRFIQEDRGVVALPDAAWFVNFSEQKLLDCISKQKGDCSGGWHGSAFRFIVTFGADYTTDYTAQKDACNERSGQFKALAWDYVNYPPDKMPSVEQLKLALLEHGPLVVLVHVDDAFLGYKGGVFNERDPCAVNHAVLLTGWDDGKHAWRIQNSWGTEWGEQGLMWIDRESNHVGQYAAWIDAPLPFNRETLTTEPPKRKTQ